MNEQFRLMFRSSHDTAILSDFSEGKHLLDYLNFGLVNLDASMSNYKA